MKILIIAIAAIFLVSAQAMRLNHKLQNNQVTLAREHEEENQEVAEMEKEGLDLTTTVSSKVRGSLVEMNAGSESSLGRGTSRRRNTLGEEEEEDEQLTEVSEQSSSLMGRGTSRRRNSLLE